VYPSPNGRPDTPFSIPSSSFTFTISKIPFSLKPVHFVPFPSPLIPLIFSVHLRTPLLFQFPMISSSYSFLIAESVSCNLTCTHHHTSLQSPLLIDVIDSHHFFYTTTINPSQLLPDFERNNANFLIRTFSETTGSPILRN
jgi:hypothetical protein